MDWPRPCWAGLSLDSQEGHIHLQSAVFSRIFPRHASSLPVISEFRKSGPSSLAGVCEFAYNLKHLPPVLSDTIGKALISRFLWCFAETSFCVFSVLAISPTKQKQCPQSALPVVIYFLLGSTAPLLVSSPLPWLTLILGHRRPPHLSLVFVIIVVVFGHVHIDGRCSLLPSANHTNNGIFRRLVLGVAGGVAIVDDRSGCCWSYRRLRGSGKSISLLLVWFPSCCFGRIHFRHMFRSFFLFPLGSLDLTLFCRTSPRSAWTSHPVQWLFAA